MTKKLLLLVVILFCLCLVLVACDKPDTDSGNTPQSKEETVTITFDTAGGSEIASIQVKKGENIPKPTDPTKDGYTLEGWYVDGEKWSFAGYDAKKDLTLTANWEPTEYTITYVTDIYHSNKATYTIEDEINLKDITKTYYEFFGWYKDENFTEPISKIEKGTVGDLTLYAKVSYNPLNFQEIDDSYMVVECDMGAKEVVIPSTHNGRPVTNIGFSAFSNCIELTSVKIPNSVTIISEYAFSSCEALTRVNIPSSVTTLCARAFENCKSLKSIEIPNSITSIGNYVFAGCESLTSIVIPGSVTTIGNNAFAYCESLASIIIPNGVTRIGNFAFVDCKSLTSIVIPDSVLSIGDYAFNRCNSLTIYCEAESQPDGWEYDWNLSNCPVVWGYVQGE